MRAYSSELGSCFCVQVTVDVHSLKVCDTPRLRPGGRSWCSRSELCRRRSGSAAAATLPVLAERFQSGPGCDQVLLHQTAKICLRRPARLGVCSTAQWHSRRVLDLNSQHGAVTCQHRTGAVSQVRATGEQDNT